MCSERQSQQLGHLAYIEPYSSLLLFSDIAFVAGAAIWNKSPQSVMWTNHEKSPQQGGLDAIPLDCPTGPHLVVPPCPVRQVGVGVSPTLDDIRILTPGLVSAPTGSNHELGYKSALKI